MSIPGKIATALRLMARFDFATLRRQWMINRSELIVRSHRGRPFVHQRLGFPSVCHSDWIDSADFFRLNAGDHWEYDLLREWLEPGDTFLDLGANVGFYSFAALPAVGPSGRVVAVDAAPFVVEKLRHSAQLLGAPNLQAVQAAVTDKDGEVTFHVCPTGFVTTEQSIRPPESLRLQSVPITVPARTLRRLQAETALDGRLSAVKIDIEGAEGAALRAAPAEWLGPEAPLWIVEINPSALARFDTSAQAVLAQFSPEHFDCWLLPKHPHDPREAPRMRPATAQDRFADSIYYNLFALPRSPRWRQRGPRLANFFPESDLTRLAG